ncbi:MAG: helix-turn-helix domain-containing protein [Acidimicrobiia bacterium]|nr:helix-turn-helix domain-containing protein [Acidimicrobiia bacterium]
MPGAPLSLPEREEISVALIEDRLVPWAVIARRVGRHPSTISREVNANGGRDRYRPALAAQRSPPSAPSAAGPVPGNARSPAPARCATASPPNSSWDVRPRRSGRTFEPRVRVRCRVLRPSTRPSTRVRWMRSQRSVCGCVGPAVAAARPATPTVVPVCPTSETARGR